jgi:hypothetical protein
MTDQQLHMLQQAYNLVGEVIVQEIAERAGRCMHPEKKRTDYSTLTGNRWVCDCGHKGGDWSNSEGIQ